MSQTAKHQDQTDAIRRRTLSVLKALTEKGKAFELPAPLDALDQCRQKLDDNTYQVLVVGEAKRGKSTFVNALIGHDLLPTDVDIATSQVFRVCPAEREAYRLRFEDDSQMAITAADLARYGSQVLAESEGVPRLDQLIRWIEVDSPVSFLPADVRVLDTPGLGALYAAHAQITHRFVPHADAVIFVLDSQAPISEPEIKFVEMILDATPNILFILTKIDQFRKEAWQAIQQRNQEILRERFKDRLADLRVWPISSINLRKAAQTGDDDYLLVSRHQELAAALQAFLFRVAGWNRSAQAVLLADRYHTESRTVLEQRVNNLVDESREKRAETQRLAQERRRQFEAAWSERGQKRRELSDGVRNASTLAKQDFRQASQPGGAIENMQREQIEHLQSLDVAKQYAEAMPAKLAEEVFAKWRTVCDQFRTQCQKLLTPFLTDVETMSLAGDAQADTHGLSAAGAKDILADRFAQTKAAWSDFAWVGMAGGTAATVASMVIATSWFPPLAGTIALGAAIWAFTRGWKLAGQRQLKEAQQKLKEFVAKQLQPIRSYFFDVDASAGRAGRVDEYFASVERSVAEQVARLATRKLDETQAELQRFQEEARLSDEQRKTKAEQLRKQLTEWDGIGHEIKSIEFELRELDRVPTLTA